MRETKSLNRTVKENEVNGCKMNAVFCEHVSVIGNNGFSRFSFNFSWRKPSYCQTSDCPRVNFNFKSKFKDSR